MLQFLGVASYSWVVRKEYQTDACDTLLNTEHFVLDRCICFFDRCQIWSKSGATITQKDFAVTDVSCQKPEKTETGLVSVTATGTCSSSYKYEFVGEGPGAVYEVFATSTCDPGTGTGEHWYFKLDTCEGGGGSSFHLVCESGKVTEHHYSSEDCSSDIELTSEMAVDECFEYSALDHTGIRLKSGC